MKLFDDLRKKNELAAKRKKLDQMVDLWEKDSIPSPYKELMTYQSVINQRGHHQFFSNICERGEAEAVLAELNKILPEELKDNLEDAYKAYLKYSDDEEDDDALCELDDADITFLENQDEIDQILLAYKMN